MSFVQTDEVFELDEFWPNRWDSWEFWANRWSFSTTTFFEIAEPQKKKSFLSKNSYFLHEIRLEKLQKYA